jgi:glycerol-3-phosphate dehydrogenase
MAEDAVDAALATGRVQVAHQCTTSRLKLLGGQAYKHTQHAEVCFAAAPALLAQLD